MTTLMNKEEEIVFDIEVQHKDDHDTKDITTNVRENSDDNFTGTNNSTNNDEENGTRYTKNNIQSLRTTNSIIKTKPKFVKYKDHYTLTKPTSSVRYRGLNTSARVIEIGDQQIILEETYYPPITTTTTTTTTTTSTVNPDAYTTGSNNNDFNENYNINSLTDINQSIRSINKKQSNSIITQQSQSQSQSQSQIQSSYTEISIRRVSSMTSGMQFLRVIYTSVAFFLFGTIFILCLQYLLYTTLDILIEIGYTSIQISSNGKDGKKSIFASLVSLFSVIGLIYGLSTLLVISQAFVYDIWNGHIILSNFFTLTTRTNNAAADNKKSNNKWFMISKLFIEWLYFIGFIGIPSITAILCLFLQKNNAWERTAQSLVIVTCITFCFFALNILFYEVHACYIVLNNYLGSTTTGSTSSTDNNNYSTKTFIGFFLSCIIFRQIRTYSGYKHIIYIASGSLDNITGTSNVTRSSSSSTDVDNDNDDKIESSRRTHSSIKIRTSIISKIVTFCTKLTTRTSTTTSTPSSETSGRCNRCCCVLYNMTEQKVIDMQDIVDVRSFITKYTWKLEAMFCRQSKQNKYIAILHGPGKLTQQQLRSSIICVGISPILIIVLVSAFIYYIDFGISFTITIFCIGLLIVLPKFIELIRIYTSINQMIETKRLHKEKLKNKLSSPLRQKIHNHTTKIDTDLLLGSSSAYLTAEKNTTGSSNNNNEQGILNSIMMNENDETDYNDNTIGIVNESEGFYRVHETYRTCTPSKCFCFTMFTIEVLVTYVIPLLGLLRRRAFTLFIIFFIIVTIAGIRYYVNVAIILEEAGHIDLLQQQQQQQPISHQNQINSSINTTNNNNTTTTTMSEYEKWRRQSQLSSIIINVTRGVSLSRFATILSTIWLLLTILLFLALGESTKTPLSFSKFEYLYDFAYIPSNGIRYASCQIIMNEERIPLTTMADYIFVSINAYRSNIDAQIEYDAWFNNGTAVLQSDIVTQWRADNNHVISPVQFQLVTFPNKGNFAVVNVRGTTNTYDLFADAQLWSASAFMQFLRFMLPAGRIWTPVIDELIWFITNIEGQTIDKVSFYKVTTQFVRFLQSQPEKYSGVALTGHSLGGGLAIISGAQTDTIAVALSGPNAMLSRDTFNPPVSTEQLNQNTFNIIPDFDIIPHIDDPAENFQKIRCRDRSILNCHDSIRSLCEILYSCGSYGRPVMCSCVTEYGFPEPLPKNGTTRSFAEACGLT